MKIGKYGAPALHRQRGVVLLIALIVLVAMTLAGIGMMRSVDTGIVITGNMAFKQTTVHAGDVGIDEGYTALMNIANSTADKPVLNYTTLSIPAGGCGTVSATYCQAGTYVFPGYSAAVINQCEVDNTCAASQTPWWTNNAYWSSSATVPPVVKYVVDDNGTGTIVVKNAVGPNDKLLNTVSYLIHRMCTTSGLGPSDSGNLCQTYEESGSTTGGSKSVGAVVFANQSVFYRITARSEGPRNTVSYSQTLVLLPE
ncbi:MAG: hypothetical protein GC139_00910 [Sideroxydans sp.]|nr:hypothetical protein [Sideroxydans sp.]